jgi:tRNA 2-selenouridine synthase
LPTAISIENFLADSKLVPVVDVRSPLEFAHGHIPGAISLPLFTDAERAEIGTIYKQKGREQAILRGFELVGPKMAGFAVRGKELAAGGSILVHCWRGGMRSGVMAWVFETIGLKASVLKGGYKTYRNYVLKQFEKPRNLCVVGGETGSGKTEILKAIGLRGEQIIDLEGLAHHRGSSFGALGQEPQPTSEQFENNFARELLKLDPAKPVWIEDESQTIGRVFIPNSFWHQKITAPAYRVRIPFETRVGRLVKDYGGFSKTELSDAILRIKKRLGGLGTQQALEAIETGDIAAMVRIALLYYDKTYAWPHENRKYEGVHFIESASGDPKLNAELILAAASKSNGQTAGMHPVS